MKFKKGDRVIYVANNEKELKNTYGIILATQTPGDDNYHIKWFGKITDMEYYEGYYLEKEVILDKKYYRSKTIKDVLK